MPERVLFVHAHPDDESISTGATIATLVDRGAAVTVLTLTRGERGEVIPDDLQHLVGSLDALAAKREAELAEALGILGVTDHRFLGNPDARWTGRPARRYVDSGMTWGKRGAEASGILDPDSLTAADPGEIAADIAAVVIDVEPDVVVTYDADGGYGHPDHVAAHYATRTAAQVLGIPFFVIAPTGAASVVVDPGALLERKRGALAAHRTQLTVDGESYSLSSGEPRALARPERFRRMRSAQTFSDMSLGARIGSGVLALVLGAFVGATLTVAHGASATIAGVEVPWGIIIALAITGALLVGLRMVFETRIVAACASVGLLGASGLLVARASGGLAPDGPVGFAWTFGPILIAALVLAWPRMWPRSRGIMGVPAAKGSDLL